MITSSSIPYISQMLNDPHSITDADIDSIVSLTETYPYFVPARYMEAASQHKQEPYNAHMMKTMQLYMGNWVIFNEYMQTAYGDGPATKPVEKANTPKDAIITPAPADVDNEAYEENTFKTDTDFWSQDEEDEDNYTAQEAEDEEPALVEAVDEEESTDTEEVYDEELVDEEEEYEEEIYEEEQAEEVSEYSAAPVANENDEALILPIYTEDYFLHQGIQVSNNIPAVDKILSTEEVSAADAAAEAAKSLMIVMSYTEWLMHFKTSSAKVREEQEDQKALKTMWQKEKLAAALEEENEEIPENVFEMAVNSITREDGLASESLADIYTKQGKYDSAMDMYKKLSLRNPQKSAYFARKIEEILKEKQS